MKAIIHSSYKSADLLKLKEINKPKPKDNELLIKVYATTVNRTDCANLYAKPIIMRLFTGLFKPRRPILGTDFAGTIEAIGSNVSGFQIGQSVFGFDDLGLGSHAEYLTISEDKAIAEIPESISFEQAAASIEGAHYAINFLNKVNITENSNILVNGGTGAIGSACIQLLKQYNVKITAVCKGEHKEQVKQLGANDIVDYEKNDYTNSKNKYDFIFDAVGKSTFSKNKKLLTDNGIYISSELGPWSQNLFYSLFTPIFCRKKVKFPFPKNIKESVLLIQSLLNKGEFEPLIDRYFTMDEIINAFKYVETGKKIGNVIIKIYPTL